MACNSQLAGRHAKSIPDVGYLEVNIMVILWDNPQPIGGMSER